MTTTATLDPILALPPPPGCEPQSIPGKLAKWKPSRFDVGFNNAGPFHYMIRSSTYGELYDEIPWKVMFGAAEDKPRQSYDNSSLVCKYRDGVLVHNWLEDRRDREYIKFNRTTPISQYGHIYKTTYGMSIGKKKFCDKQTAALRKINEFPKNVFPGHQPELDVDRVRECVEKPRICIGNEEQDKWYKCVEYEKRKLKANPTSSLASN